MESRTSRRRADKRTSAAKGRKGLANFVSKLVDILDNADPRLAGWTPSGKAFLVHDPKRFGAEVLAKVFKSGNFSSFIRQLNFYSFHKNVQSEAAWEFSHPCFVRGRPDLMAQIKRKTSSEYHASYDVELAKLRASLAESQAAVESMQAQLTAATAALAKQQRDAAVASAIAEEANRRLASNGLPTVSEADCGSVGVGNTRLASTSVGISVGVNTDELANATWADARPSKKRRRSAHTQASAKSGAGARQVRFTADVEMDAGMGSGSAPAQDVNAAMEPVDFSFGGTSPLPDDLFDGLFNMDLADGRGVGVGASGAGSPSGNQREAEMGELDLSWFTDNAPTSSTDYADESLPPMLTRSISNLSMGPRTPRALGSLEAEPSLALAPVSIASASMVNTSEEADMTDVAARVSELSQDEQREMAVRLFRLLAAGGVGAPPAADASEPAAAPAVVSSTPAQAAPRAAAQPAAVGSSAETALEQQVPPHVLFACLMQVPAVSMAVMGTGAVVATAAAAAAKAAADARSTTASVAASRARLLSPLPVTTAQ